MISSRIVRYIPSPSRPTGWAALALFILVSACSDSAPAEDAAAAEDMAGQTPPTEMADPGAAPAEGEPRTIDISDLGMDLSDPDASQIDVIEFSDFGCVHCADFHTNTFPELEEEFVVTDQVFWKYIPVSLGGFPNSEAATVAGICAAEQGLFPELRDRIFAERETWMTTEEGQADPLFMGYAAEVGVDSEAFETCFGSDAPHEQIQANNEAAQAIGIRVTPTFVVQGRGIPGSPPLDQFQDALRDLIAQTEGAEATPPSEDEPGA